jgi:amidohydrolase
MVLAAARTLKALESRLPWPCPWRAIFQPAEETGLGALEMIQAGAVDDVRALIAFHVAPDIPAGKVGVKDGELTAGCQDIDVIITGKGGHAARPHLSIDPIAAAVQFLGDVYCLVPRHVDARDPVVVTFGSIHGGEKNNVIPDRVFLKGTIRTLSRKSAEEVRAVLEKIRRGMEELTGTSIVYTFDDYMGPVYNSSGVVAQMSQAAADVVGPENLIHLPKASMGAEDFGNYLGKVPGCMLRLGVGMDGQPPHHLHTPNFDIDEQALVIGAKILARTLVLLARR